MIELLVQGHLIRKPEARTDVKGKIYTTATLQATNDSGSPEILFLISHVPTVGLTLQSMDVGDSVSLSGSLTIKREEGRVTFGINARKLISFHPSVRLPR